MSAPAHYLKRRDFLHSEKTPAAQLSQAGREFLAAERYSDALDFFEKARDQDGIKEIKKIALAQGDTFLLARLDRFDRALVAAADWEAAARQAEALGKSSMSAYVARKFAPPPAAAGAPVEPKPAEKPGEAPLAEV